MTCTDNDFFRPGSYSGNTEEIVMKPVFVTILALVMAGCSGGVSGGGAVRRTPVTIAGVTYQWPYDGSADVGDPSTWRTFALLPSRVWNATVGTIPSAHLERDEGHLTIWVSPTVRKKWAVAADGTGLPLVGSTVFQASEDQDGYVLGKGAGPGIVAPATLVLFKGEPEAYASCTPAPAGRVSACFLFLNDRGVQHTLPLKWGAWRDVPSILKLYRSLIGIPAI
jgi:hypothetical protein